ncbi:MAG: hypothetical protein ACLFRV_03510 [Acidimicrobiales bacterium]
MSSPDWTLTGDTVARLRDELETVDDETRADFDAFSSFVVEQLGEYRIDPATDEWATYHGLAYMSLLVDLARNNYENGAIDHQTAAAVSAIAHGVASVLARHAPG